MILWLDIRDILCLIAEDNLFLIAEEGNRKTKLPYFEIMMKTVYLQC